MIKKFVVGSILDDLRSGDHVIFSLNKNNVHPGTDVGYGFVNEVIEDHVAAFKDIGTPDIGTVITHESESGVLFHGIVNHSIEYGWDYDGDHYYSYEAIKEALDELYEKYDDYITKPMRSLWLGRGKMRRIGENQGNINWNLQAMANSKAELAVYILDGYEED